MNSRPNHETTLIKTIREGRAVIVIGTGVSIAASFDATTKQPHPQASWTGLLEDGLNWLKDHNLIDDEVADAQLKLLKKNPQAHRFISAAEDVTAGMGGANSPHFANWLKRTVGSIKANDRSILDALDAIRQQGNLLATTNYDGLLLDERLELEPVTWLETDDLIGVVRHRDTNRIIFLHGYWLRPESVILDWKSYDKIARNEDYRDDLAAFWKTSIWIFVGCGVNGLTDPDFGLLLERYGNRARQAGHWDYCLVLDEQRDEFQAYFDANKINIRAIPFGKEHADLPNYLRSLLSAPPREVVATAPASANQNMSAEAFKTRNRYLKDAQRDFKNRLSASIHHARFIDLGIQDDPAAIKPAWGYQDPDTKQSYDTVAEAFDVCDRRLLLLGSPGSGKTTALLHLAKLLAEDAEQSQQAAIPFVVNLSKFQLNRLESSRQWLGFGQSKDTSEDRNENENFNMEFEDWLVSEMATFPGLGRELAREWIRQRRVAVLLDGLDEFNDERRAELVRLLNNTFLRQYPDLTVVICSRTNEYLVLRSFEETRLQLRGCVHLQPLNDDQIAVYLDAAQAGGLLSALPNDSALGELAKTPLTLSMLVLAYGGLAPTDLPKTGSLSENRHHLFESYVTRMLQRQERRKRDIPFDDSKFNDVPIFEYSYHPDKVHRWLGWLALALSLRMRTSFSVDNFHSILRIGVKPTRQPFNFTAVYLAIGALLLILLCLIALPIVPVTSAGLLNTAFIGVSMFLLFPLVASGNEDWSVGLIFLIIAILAVVQLDFYILLHLLHLSSAIFSSAISPLPVKVILLFALFLLAHAAILGVNNKAIQICGLCFIASIVGVIGIQILPDNQQLPFLDRVWWQVVIVTILFAPSISFILWKTDSLREKITNFGVVIALVVASLFSKGMISELSWIIGLVAIDATLMLIVAVVKIPTVILFILGYSLFAFTGGVMASHYGAFLGVSLFGLLCATYSAVWESLDRHKRKRSPRPSEMMQTGDVRENWLERLTARNKIVADGILRSLDRIILSPCLWGIIAIGRRFPWQRDRFIAFCKEAFLLKQSSQEYEFTHRLLRDYFALRELRPRLSASDKNQRLDAIRFLGYQGEAALDALTEFAENQDPLVRAAALTGLSHIASPIVIRCFEFHINDRDPLVRQALISGMFKLNYLDRSELLSKIKPLGNGCEVNPLLDDLQLWRYNESQVYDLIKKLGNSAIKPLMNSLQSRDKSVRQATLGMLAQFVGEVERQLLSIKMDGGSPWLDPAKPISQSRVIQCAKYLYISETVVVERYRFLADKFELKIKL